jgi:hypothetical protein
MTANVWRQHTMGISFIAGESCCPRPRRHVVDKHRESIATKITFQRRLPRRVGQLDNLVQEMVSDPLVLQPRPEPFHLIGQRQDSVFHLREIPFGPLTIDLAPSGFRGKRGTIGSASVALPLETSDVVPLNVFTLHAQPVQVRELGSCGGRLLFDLIARLAKVSHLQLYRLLAA